MSKITVHEIIWKMEGTENQRKYADDTVNRAIGYIDNDMIPFYQKYHDADSVQILNSIRERILTEVLPQYEDAERVIEMRRTIFSKEAIRGAYDEVSRKNKKKQIKEKPEDVMEKNQLDKLYELLEVVEAVGDKDTAAALRESLQKQAKKDIKPKKCDSCKKEDCSGCEDYYNRCPSCNEGLDRDNGEIFKFCPNCGQALNIRS